MPCRETETAIYSGALAADWNVRDDAQAFYYAIKVGKMTADQVRADIGCDEHDIQVLRTLYDQNDPYEQRQIEKIVAKRRRTLALFEKLLRQNIPIHIKLRRKHRARSNPVSTGVCAGPGSIQVESPGLEPGLA